MLLLVFNSVNALVIDNFGIVNQNLTEKIENFGKETGMNFVLIVTEDKEDSISFADQLFSAHEAELLVLYTIKQNEITVAEPLNEGIASEKVIRILELAEGEDINEILDDVVSSLIEATEEWETVSGVEYCNIIKDGYCDPNCEGDLDCLCGDGVCQQFETYVTCPQDCKGEEPSFFCDFRSDGVCQKTCLLLDPDCKIEDLINKTFVNVQVPLFVWLKPLLIIIIALLILLLVYFLVKEIKIK